MMKADVTKHLVYMKSALNSMGVRMSHLETKQKELEDDTKISETRSDILAVVPAILLDLEDASPR